MYTPGTENRYAIEQSILGGKFSVVFILSILGSLHSFVSSWLWTLSLKHKIDTVQSNFNFPDFVRIPMCVCTCRDTNASVCWLADVVNIRFTKLEDRILMQLIKFLNLVFG